MAHKLGENPSCTEAEFRTAVGRIYYSLYHVSFRRLLVIKELEGEPSNDAHSTVISAVKAIKMNLGEKLDKLRHLRRQADYYLDTSDPRFNNWPKNYRDAQSIASLILPALENLERRTR